MMCCCSGGNRTQRKAGAMVTLLYHSAHCYITCHKDRAQTADSRMPTPGCRDPWHILLLQCTKAQVRRAPVAESNLTRQESTLVLQSTLKNLSQICAARDPWGNADNLVSHATTLLPTTANTKFRCHRVLEPRTWRRRPPRRPPCRKPFLGGRRTCQQARLRNP